MLIFCYDAPILGDDANLTPSIHFSTDHCWCVYQLPYQLFLPALRRLLPLGLQLGVEESLLVVLDHWQWEAGRRISCLLVVHGLVSMFDVIPSLGILCLVLDALTSLVDLFLSIGILWGFRPQSRCCRHSASNLVVDDLVLQAALAAAVHMS